MSAATEGRGSGPLNPRVMARGDELRAELVRALEQRAELQMLVAQDARIGRASSPVFSGKMSDDLLLKLFRVVNQMKRDAEMVANGAHVGRRARPAALELVVVWRKTVVLPEFERDADDVIALLDQQRRGRGRIHSAAHAANNALPLFQNHRRTLYAIRAACKMV